MATFGQEKSPSDFLPMPYPKVESAYWKEGNAYKGAAIMDIDDMVLAENGTPEFGNFKVTNLGYLPDKPVIRYRIEWTVGFQVQPKQGAKVYDLSADLTNMGPWTGGITPANPPGWKTWRTEAFDNIGKPPDESTIKDKELEF